MGMTIDEAKLNLIDIQKYYNEDMQDCYVYEGFDEEDNETVNIAIETMRKYKKIQEIVKQKDYDRFNSRNYYGDFLRVQDIREVLEDGNG